MNSVMKIRVKVTSGKEKTGALSRSRSAIIAIARSLSVALRVDLSALFLQIVQLFDEGLGRVHVLQITQFLPFGIEHDNGRVALNLIFFLQGLIGFLLVCRQLFVPRKVHLDEYQIFLGVISKFLRRENVLIQLNAPAAPIGAGEVQHDQLVFFLGLRLCFGQIRIPLQLCRACLQQRPTREHSRKDFFHNYFSFLAWLDAARCCLFKGLSYPAGERRYARKRPRTKHLPELFQMSNRQLLKTAPERI